MLLEKTGSKEPQMPLADSRRCTPIEDALTSRTMGLPNTVQSNLYYN